MIVTVKNSFIFSETPEKSRYRQLRPRFPKSHFLGKARLTCLQVESRLGAVSRLTA